jgi:hypothetical protein
MPTTTEHAVFVCALAHASEAGIVIRGEKLRAGDPRIAANPGAFVPLGTPQSEWPSDLDYAIRLSEERARAEAEAAARAHREAAERNKLKLKPTLYRVKRDTETDRGGVPALVLRGSVLTDDDPLVAAHPEDVEQTK